MTSPLIAPSAPLSFSFSADNTIRVVMRDAEPWFVAADARAALDWIAAEQARRIETLERDLEEERAALAKTMTQRASLSA